MIFIAYAGLGLLSFFVVTGAFINLLAPDLVKDQYDYYLEQDNEV